MAPIFRRPLPLLAQLAVFGCMLAAGASAHAVSCTTQAQMHPEDRTALAGAALRLAGVAQGGDVQALRAAMAPAAAGDFDSLAATAKGLAPAVRSAKLEVQTLYTLDAHDIKNAGDEAQFFCSAPGSPLLVTLSFPSLPAGQYALALLRTEGDTPAAQHIALVLQQSQGGAPWQLAGLFARPATLDGHDGTWYWTHARELRKDGASWSAYFYYQTARPLLVPVDFLSSPNLEKLEREAQLAAPAGLPGEAGTPPMTVAAADQTFSVTSMRTDGSLGGLDLLLHYNANAANVDPVFQRAQAVALMRALLQQHPELRDNFHGLWVYADSPGRQPYAVEMTMQQIAAAADVPTH
jgi:hypothetical protein